MLGRSLASSDLGGMYDWVHVKLLLQQVAACVMAHHTLKTPTASTAASTASWGGAREGSARQQEFGGSSLAVADSGVQHRRLPHQSSLHLDLQQVQQLLLWAVLGPSCTSQQQLATAQDALRKAFSAGALGIKDRQELQAGVQVDGGRIADAIECVAQSKQGGRGEAEGGRWSEDSEGDGQSEVIMPLGLCLGLEDLCALLAERLG